MQRSAYLAATAVAASLAAAPMAQAVTPHQARAVARQAVAGISHDLVAHVSVFHCREHGARAVCEVRIDGSFQTLHARVLERWTSPVLAHYQVKDITDVTPLPDAA